MATALRLLGLGSIPPGLHFDEAVYGLLARDIQAGARPVFFSSYTGREPLYMYLLAIAFSAAGSTALVLRLASAAAGIVTVALMFPLGRALHGRRVGLIASALLVVSYWHLTVSRNGYPNILIPPLEAASFFFLWRAWGRCRPSPALVRTRSTSAWPDWIVGGALAGLVLYTYLAARFYPVFLLGFFALALIVMVVSARRGGVATVSAKRSSRRRMLGLAAASLACLVVFAPLLLHFLRVPGDFFQRADQVLLWREFQGSELARAFAGNAWRTAQGLVVPGHGDGRWHFNLPGRAVFQPLVAAGFLVGVVVSVARVIRPATSSPPPSLEANERAAAEPDAVVRHDARLRYLAALLWVVVLALPGVLTAELQPAGQRIFGTIPALAILAGVGISQIAGWMAGAWDRVFASASRGSRSLPQTLASGTKVATALVVLAVLIDLRSTVADYFGHWGTHPETYNIFNSDYASMASAAADDLAEGREVVLLSRHYKHPTVAFLEPELVDGAKWAEPMLALPIPAPRASSDSAVTPPPSTAYYLPDSYFRADEGAPQRDLPADEWLSREATTTRRLGPPRTAGDRVGGVTRYEVPRTDLGAIDRDAVFNGEVAVAESASRLNVDRGAEVAVPVEWEVIGVPDSGRGFALHLRDARGLTWAQADVSGYLSEQWRVGDRVLAWFPLALDARMPPGEYEAFLLMVDEAGTPFGWHGSATPGAAGGVEVKVADVVVSRARAGRQSPPALADGGSLGTLGGLTARSALMPEEALTPGSGFEVAIEWAKNGASAGPLSLVAVDSAGRRHDLGEVDAAYGYPVSQWEDGDVVLGRYGLRMPAALTGDSATLLVASGEDEVALGSLAVRAVERVFATPSTARPADTEFAPGARLIGYEIDPDGSTVAVTLYWRADEADLPAGKVFVHLHRGGAPAAQHDSEPAGGTRSFPSLVPGEVVADRHEIVLPPGETAEDLEVGVGIYDPGTGARWSVRGAVSTEDRLELGPVR